MNTMAAAKLRGWMLRTKSDLLLHTYISCIALMIALPLNILVFAYCDHFAEMGVMI